MKEKLWTIELSDGIQVAKLKATRYEVDAFRTYDGFEVERFVKFFEGDDIVALFRLSQIKGWSSQWSSQ